MTAGVVGAVITACAAVAGVVITQLLTAQRARADRRYERRRTTLIDVQEAALTLRDALRDYGPALERLTASALPAEAGRPDPLGRVLDLAPDSGDVDRAKGRLDVYAVRLEGSDSPDSVAAAVDGWRVAAEEHFISTGERTAASEQSAWSTLHLRVAAALRQ